MKAYEWQLTEVYKASGKEEAVSKELIIFIMQQRDK